MFTEDYTPPLPVHFSKALSLVHACQQTLWLADINLYCSDCLQARHVGKIVVTTAEQHAKRQRIMSAAAAGGRVVVTARSVC